MRSDLRMIEMKQKCNKEKGRQAECKKKLITGRKPPKKKKQRKINTQQKIERTK